jgi:hypothetical protein
MALHRDIYWVGRQWAVTGYGIQACDQKQKSKFDIESGRLWEDGVLEDMRELKWLNTEDFDKAISVARKYYPEPAASPGKIVALPAESVPDLKETGEKAQNLKAPSRNETTLKETSLTESPAAEPNSPAQKFDMRVEGWPAKFVRQWRIRIRR